MSDPFIGEIRMFSFSWAPRDFALCSGDVMAITDNAALFSLIGTAFGGDGRVSFGLPDLRGRAPVHNGSEIPTRGALGGNEDVTLTPSQMPSHTHLATASNQTPTTPIPSDQVVPAQFDMYGTPPANLVTMKNSIVSSAGGGQAHTNVQPSLVFNFSIATDGVYPSRN